MTPAAARDLEWLSEGLAQLVERWHPELEVTAVDVELRPAASLSLSVDQLAARRRRRLRGNGEVGLA